MKMSEEKDTHFTAMLWGPYKTGKTVLASQFPNPHFITLDPQALMSVRGLRSKYKLDFDVDTINITEEETTDPEYLKLVGSKSFAKMPGWEKTKKLTRSWIKNLGQDDTLIIDNLSRAHEMLRRSIKPNGGKFGWDEWAKYIDELEDLQEILYSGERRCLVIIIAHEEVREDDLTGEKKRYIMIQTSKRHRLPALVTDHLYMFNKIKGGRANKKVIRQIQTVPADDTDTGSRALVPDIEYPTFAKLKPYFEAALGRALPEPNWTPPEDE